MKIERIIKGKGMPPCKISEVNEPNLELIVRALYDLYQKTKHYADKVEPVNY